MSTLAWSSYLLRWLQYELPSAMTLSRSSFCRDVLGFIPSRSHMHSILDSPTSKEKKSFITFSWAWLETTSSCQRGAGVEQSNAVPEQAPAQSDSNPLSRTTRELYKRKGEKTYCPPKLLKTAEEKKKNPESSGRAAEGDKHGGESRRAGPRWQAA